MQNTENVLKSHPFFNGIDEWYIEQMARYAKEKEFQKGDYLIREAEDADKFFLILSGEIEVGNCASGRFLPIQSLNKNDIVGWSWLISPHKWHFDAIAACKSKVIILDGRYLRSKCEEDTKLGYEILKRLTQHIIQRLNALRFQGSLT